MSTDKLPDDVNDYPPAAFGAGAPPESYATYTKLRSGAFGVRVPGGAKPGMLVDVRTKAGALRQERIGHVLWTGNDRFTGELMALCTVEGARVPAQKPAQPQPQTQRPANNKRQPIPTQPKPAGKPKRPGRQPMPRIAADDNHDNRELSDATQARVARIDDERAEAEAKLGKDEPLF